MAKLSADERATLQAGYDCAAFEQGKGGQSVNRNPHLWSSPMWEAYEFGFFLHEKGLSPDRGWQRGRGSSFWNPDGARFKLWYSKGGGFGIERIS